MADLIPKNTDEEIERYMEADMVRRAGIPMEGNAALKFEADPITKRENAYFPLSSGGYVKIGERAVKPKDTAKTDVLAAARDIQNDARGPISEVMGGAEGPTMADYQAANFTEAEVLAFWAEEEARRLAHPGMQVAVQLTPEQVQFGVDVGAPMSAPEEPGLFEGALSEVGKGLIRGGLIEPSRFLKDNFGIYDPVFFQVTDPETGEFSPRLRILSRAEYEAMNAGEMPNAVNLETLFESGDPSQTGPGAKIMGGIAQFVGAYAGVGKLSRIGKGFIGGATQGAGADFLGFGGDEGRLTDLLLDLGVPENQVTDFLRTDPNDPDYVGRFKNALEGGAIGAVAEQIGPVYRLIKDGGNKAQLSQAIDNLRDSSAQTFSNTISDFIGTGRAVMQGDREMLGEIFQPAGTPRSLGAAAPDPETAGAITAFHGSPYDFDAFDITKMGTGEGAQAYGPGLYFAESEDVAREYRDNMLDARIPQLNDRLREISREMSAISTGYRQWRPGQEERGKALAAEYEDLMAQRSSMRGRLYEVNIRANPEDFLNWDAPISQQSEKVREALMPFVERRIAQMGEAGNRFTTEQWMDRLRGGDVMLLDKVGDTPVSRALIETGVPGVRYLDQSSRAAGQGTRNIVVFDDQLVDIVRKYGVAGLAIGAAIQSEAGIQDQIEGDT